MKRNRDSDLEAKLSYKVEIEVLHMLASEADVGLHCS